MRFGAGGPCNLRWQERHRNIGGVSGELPDTRMRENCPGNGVSRYDMGRIGFSKMRFV